MDQSLCFHAGNIKIKSTFIILYFVQLYVCNKHTEKINQLRIQSYKLYNQFGVQTYKNKPTQLNSMQLKQVIYKRTDCIHQARHRMKGFMPAISLSIVAILVCPYCSYLVLNNSFSWISLLQIYKSIQINKPFNFIERVKVCYKINYNLGNVISNKWQNFYKFNVLKWPRYKQSNTHRNC